MERVAPCTRCSPLAPRRPRSRLRSPGAPPPSSAAHRRARCRVVASTDVCGDIAQQIGGATCGDVDHRRPSTRTRTSTRPTPATSWPSPRADVVVENGGGYDDFVDTMLSAPPAARARSPRRGRAVSGYDQQPSAGEFNEHVWYDLPDGRQRRRARSRADHDGRSRPARRLRRERCRPSTAKLDALAAARPRRIRARRRARASRSPSRCRCTSPSALGLVNRTPHEFSEAIEEGTDVAAACSSETLALFSGRRSQLLAYNEQTDGRRRPTGRRRGEGGAASRSCRSRETAARPGQRLRRAGCRGPRAPSPRRSRAVTAAPVLRLRDATLDFGGAHALERARPRRRARASSSRCSGRTDPARPRLLKAVLGAAAAHARARCASSASPCAAGDRRIGYVPQQRLLDARRPRCAARDLVALRRRRRTAAGCRSAAGAERARVDELVDAVGAAAVRGRAGLRACPAASSSGCASGQALADDPPLLLCDEPLHLARPATPARGQRADRPPPPGARRGGRSS